MRGPVEERQVVIRDSISDSHSDLLRAVLGSTGYGFMVTDLDHVAIACNGEFGRIFGIDPGEVVRNNVLKVRQMVRNRIADFAGWQANLEEVYGNPERVQVDELLLKNPKTVIRRWTGPVKSENGAVIGRLWTFLDVSRETHLHAISETLAEVASFFDPEPKVVYQHLVELVGKHYDSVSVLSVRVGDFMEFRAVGGPDSPAKEMRGNRLTDSYCQFCLQADEPLIIQDSRVSDSYSEILPAKFGLTRYAGVPIRTPAGEPIGTLCILDSKSEEILGQDDLRFLELVALRISGELDRELQVMALRNDLEAREEGLRRAHHRLIQSEKLAITGMFSAAIAHDIRNILSAISLEISLYSSDPDESLRMVQQHLSRFSVLSHRLLSYARPAEVAQETVCLSQVLDSVVALLQSHLRLSEISAELKHEPNLPEIQADPVRLEHLFVNLIMNAIQAMRSGGELNIWTYGDPEWVTVEVRDTGMGIPTARLIRMFEPFHSGRSNGFGLGLYSCQQIMQEVGGTIDVASEVGIGTTFTLKFPKCQKSSLSTTISS